MKKVGIITTGGTIYGVSKSCMDFSNYQSGKDSENHILQQVPEINDLAEIYLEEFENVSSCEISPCHWNLLRERAHFYLNEQGFDGLVIAHGTNTMEETAYFLHLTCNTEKPIVLVGSQRPPTALNSDAYLNLYNAVRLAASPNAQGKGVLVMLNDEIEPKPSNQVNSAFWDMLMSMEKYVFTENRRNHIRMNLYLLQSKRIHSNELK